MDSQSSSSPDNFRTPSPKRRKVEVTTPSPPPAPKKINKEKRSWIFQSLDELSERFAEGGRQRRKSEQYLEAERQRKIRILMSMRLGFHRPHLHQFLHANTRYDWLQAIWIGTP